MTLHVPPIIHSYEGITHVPPYQRILGLQPPLVGKHPTLSTLHYTILRNFTSLLVNINIILFFFTFFFTLYFLILLFFLLFFIFYFIFIFDLLHENSYQQYYIKFNKYKVQIRKYKKKRKYTVTGYTITRAHFETKRSNIINLIFNLILFKIFELSFS